MNTTSPKIRRQAGFGMVESLVALVVLGVGMLGIASLYVVTLRSSSSAISRMQAVNLASDLGDRIRANRIAIDEYENAAGAANRGCIGGAVSCSATEMAQHDLWDWQRQIGDTLPGGSQGVVEVTPGSPRTIVITLSWTEPGDNQALSYAMQMQLQP